MYIYVYIWLHTNIHICICIYWILNQLYEPYTMTPGWNMMAIWSTHPMEILEPQRIPENCMRKAMPWWIQCPNSWKFMRIPEEKISRLFCYANSPAFSPGSAFSKLDLLITQTPSFSQFSLVKNSYSWWNPWKSMEIHGNPWKAMEIHGKPCSFFFCPGRPQ